MGHSEYRTQLAKLNQSLFRRYYLDMPGAPSSMLADIFAFDGTRGIGEPTKYTITFTHPSHSLSREEYVGKMANFVIQPRPPTQYGFTKVEPPAEVKGIVTSFAWIGSSRDQSTYEIVLESRLALLRNTPKVRFFYDVTIPEVLMQVLKENGFDHLHASFEFLKFHHTYRKRPIITQWEQDDLGFIDYLCRRAGIWYVCESTEHGESIVFGDDLTHYARDDSYHMPYRPESGLHDSGVESVNTLTMRATSIPRSYFVRSYNPENGYEPIDASLDLRDDETTYGEAYTYGLPYLTRDDAADEVRIQQQAALAGQIVYEGDTNKLIFGPRFVVQLTNRVLPDAEHGLVIVRIHVSASRKQGYKVQFTAIPAELERPYRLPLSLETWPRISGTITGTVASPNDYAHPFITKQGGYVVQIHADRDARAPGANSCVMYVAKPYAGKHYTGMHFGLVDGTLVAIAFYHGHPDLPYIAHALHSSIHPDPINSSDRWLSRDTIHFRSNNTIESENWQGEEHIKLSTEHGKSQLNLGHTVSRNPERKHRGSGFELRSDMRGAVRAGGGLLLTAETQAKAQGDIADMAGAKQIYQRTQEQAEALMQAVSAAKAEVADLQAERQWLKDELADLKKSVIALSAPAGIAVATPDRVSVAAGKDVNVTTLWGFNVSAMKTVAMAAKEKLSLFAYQLGIGIRAAKGPVEIQAQSDVMSLAAQKDMTVSSVDGAVRVRAKQDIMIECGGAFIEIKDGNITLGGPGKLLFKFASMSKQRAQMAHLSAPAFATTTVPFKTSCEAWLSGNTTVAKVSPPSEAVDWKQFDNAAPAPAPKVKAPSNKPSVIQGKAPTENPETPQIPTDSPEHPNADHDSAHEPKLPTTPNSEEPALMQVAPPVWCDWAMPDRKQECRDQTETPRYKALTKLKAPWVGNDGDQIISGGNFPTAFELSYVHEAKTLTASVIVKLVPVDLVKSDALGNPLLNSFGAKESVPYDHDKHYRGVAAGVNRPFEGLVMEYREGVGDSVDLNALRRQVEKTLNGHRSMLVLDGCSKGASCGCRIKVDFRVNFITSVRNVEIGKFHKEIRLFRRAARADAGSWGEEMWAPTANDLQRYTSFTTNNVVAHECGHLFNYPDEYWEYGGFIHQSYVSGEQIDFVTGAALNGKDIWQISSINNLMGGGCNLPRATAGHYHLQYIRRHFSELSNKKWRIGYEA